MRNQESSDRPFWSGTISRFARAVARRDIIFLFSVLLYIVFFIILYKWKNFGMGVAAIIPVITAAWFYGTVAGCATGMLSLAANIVMGQLIGIDWYTRIIKTGAGFEGTSSLIVIGFIIGRISDLSRRLKKELAHKEQVEHELELNRQSLEKLVQDKTAKLSAALQELQATNTELAASEKRLRSIIETAIDAIITVDSSGTIIDWNKTAEKMYGYTVAEAVGMPASVLIPERLRSRDRQGMEEAVRQGAEEVVYSRIEACGLRKDGAEFPTEVSQSVWKSGGEVFATGIIRDITERRKAETSLRESEARLRAIFDGAVDAIVTTDINGQIITWNKAAVSIFGYTAEEILGKPIQLLIPASLHFQDNAAWREGLQVVDERLNFVRRESQCVRKNGAEFPVEVSQSFWKSGDMAFATAIVRDITERKKSEKELLEREARLRSVVDTAVDAIITVNSAGMIVDWNHAAEEIYGYTAEEIIGKPAAAIIPARLHALDSRQMHAAVEQGKERLIFNRREGIGIRKDGYEFPTEVSQSVWKSGDEIFATGIVRDITERKKAEKALLEREARLRSIVETAVDGIITSDSTGTIVFWNQAAEKIYGYTAEEIIGKNVKLLLPERFHQIENEGLTKAFRSRSTPTNIASIGVRKDGSEFAVEVARALWESEDQIYATAIVRDITDRKNAERDRMLLSSVIEQAHENILIMDAQGTILFINPAVAKQMNRQPDEIVGKNGFQATGSIYDPQSFKAIYAQLKSGSPWTGVMQYKTGENKTASIEQTLSPVFDTEGRLINILSISRDISREHYLEEQLRQSQKMEAIGTLAGGIAHDFNNILAAILGYTELAAMEVPRDSITAERLQHVINSCDRARSLVRQILTFSRKNPREATPCKVSSIVREAAKLLRASLPSTVDIRQDIRDDGAVVKADPTQFHQLIINLCTNAAQAMEESGGILTISLEPCILTADAMVGSYDLPPGAYVRLTVRDTGPGIAPEIKERIFEPFFTTKAVGKGTGMGLAVAHGIVTSCGGSIHVDSKPGGGAAFHVLLPRIDAELQEHAEQKTADPPRGSGTILFVDDEEEVMQIGRSMLESLGYTVFSTTSSLQAIEMFGADPGRFDCVITDMTMPQLRGDELAGRLLALRPELPIVLCTGFSEKISEDQALSMGIRAFLLKPFSMQDLGETVQKMLAG